MMKIKKVITLKVAIFIILVFNLNAMVYAIELSDKTNLRVPLFFNRPSGLIRELSEHIRKVHGTQSRRSLPVFNNNSITLLQHQMAVSKYSPNNPMFPRYIQSFGAGPCVIVTFYCPSSKIGGAIHVASNTDVYKSLEQLFMVVDSEERVQIRLLGGYKEKFMISMIAALMRFSNNINYEIVELEMNKFTTASAGETAIILDLFDGTVYNMEGVPELDMKEVDRFMSLPVFVSGAAYLIRRDIALWLELGKEKRRANFIPLKHIIPFLAKSRNNL